MIIYGNVFSSLAKIFFKHIPLTQRMTLNL